MENEPNLSLEDDICNDTVIIQLIEDIAIAKQFYSGLCNITWKKIRNIPEDQLIVETLKGNEYWTWACTWRTAGRIIADLRCNHYEYRESYMDFYCSGNEGNPTELVKEHFKRLGWTILESDY